MSNELSVEDFHNPSHLPVIQTADVQRFIDSFNAWLHPENRQPFIVIGPEGCGKGLAVWSHWLFISTSSSSSSIINGKNLLAISKRN